MKKLSLIILFISSFLFAQGQNLWQKSDKPSATQEIDNVPENAEIYNLDLESIKQILKSSPKEFTKSRGTIIEIPMPDMGVKQFEVWYSSIMEDELQAKFPNIRTYRAKEVNGDAIGRIDISVNGLNGSFSSPKGSYYLRAGADKENEILLYRLADLKVNDSNNSCGTLDSDIIAPGGNQISETDKHLGKKGGEPVDLRTYRIAVATSGEWYDNYGGGSIESSIAKIVTTMNRVNEVYERDVAIRMLLIGNNDQLIFTDLETDPYNQPTSGGGTVGTNTSILNNAVGVNSYDIGHVFMRCTDVGGVASGLLCLDQSKGNGVTCWTRDDPLGLGGGTIAHELGHQMSAPHTWSNCGNPDQLASGTAYEPGSGNTIMSYFGLCGGNNTSGTDGTYFHINSCSNIISWSRLADGNTCAQIISTANTNPTAFHNYTDGFSIPVRTPFKLEGDATDSENDDLSYKWEQYNLGPLSELGSPTGNAPCFIAYDADNIKERTFPRINDIVNNRSSRSEVLVDYARDFTFRFIVRDNNAEAGGLDFAELKFKTDGSAGPFEVLYPNSRETLTVGEEIPIVWDVANTDNNTVNCQKVNISYSIDGGYTYNLLVSGTDNDGEADIVVPNAPANLVRFRIDAADNIFFDISDLNSEIVEPSEPTFVLEYPIITETLCLPSELNIPISTQGFLGFDENINFEIAGLPVGATADFSQNTVSTGQGTNLYLDFADEQNTGDYDLLLTASSTSGVVLERTLAVRIVSNDYSDLVLQTPANGNSGETALPIFSWNASSAAETYTIEIATSPNFGASTVIIENGLTDTEFTPSALLENNTLYYWRVSGTNECGAGQKGSVNGFHTASLRCEEYAATDVPINMSASGVRTIESKIQIFESGIIQDANVENIAGLHDRTSDLRMSLTSPSGTTVLLINRKCGNLSNFDMGFDDEAPATVTCPIQGGTSFQPAEALSAFINEERMGTWTLTVEDLAPGNGGRLNSFELELCASFDVISPIINANNTLFVGDLETKSIGNDLLSTSDANNSAAELNYTLVSNTTQGEVKMGGQVLTIGDQFSQMDINNSFVSYTHTGALQVRDHFDFAVQDNEGGWDGVQRFNIMIDTESDVNDLSKQVNISLFPNPASDLVFLQLDEALQNSLVQIFAIDGKLNYSNRIENLQNLEINTCDFSEGIYFVKISTAEGIATKKLIVNR